MACQSLSFPTAPASGRGRGPGGGNRAAGAGREDRAETGNLGDPGRAGSPKPPGSPRSVCGVGTGSPAPSRLSETSSDPCSWPPQGLCTVFSVPGILPRVPLLHLTAPPPSGHSGFPIRLLPHCSLEPWCFSFARHLSHLASYQLAGSSRAKRVAVPQTGIHLCHWTVSEDGAREPLGPRPPGMTLLWFPSLAQDQLLSGSRTPPPCHLQGCLSSGDT